MLFHTPVNSMSPLAEIECAGRQVLALHLDLSVLGWHGNAGVPINHPAHYSVAKELEVHERVPTSADRERFDYEHVRTALRFLEETGARRRSAVNPKYGSYGLKHRAERFGVRAGLSRYIANGEFILAALLAGFECYRAHTPSPNCRFNISFAAGALGETTDE